MELLSEDRDKHGRVASTLVVNFGSGTAAAARSRSCAIRQPYSAARLVLDALGLIARDMGGGETQSRLAGSVGHQFRAAAPWQFAHHGLPPKTRARPGRLRRNRRRRRRRRFERQRRRRAVALFSCAPGFSPCAPARLSCAPASFSWAPGSLSGLSDEQADGRAASAPASRSCRWPRRADGRLGWPRGEGRMVGGQQVRRRGGRHVGRWGGRQVGRGRTVGGRLVRRAVRRYCGEIRWSERRGRPGLSESS